MAPKTRAALEQKAAECVGKSLAAKTEMERIKWQLKARNIHAAIEIQEGLAALAARRNDASRR